METDGAKELRLSVSNIAALFGVSEQAIANWVKAGMPFVRVKGKVNVYPWRPCLEWWLVNRYTGATASDKKRGVPHRGESEAKLFQIKAEREQMKLDIELGKLIPIDDIERTWVQAAGIVKDRVLTIAPALKLVIPLLTQTDMAKIRAVCNETLETIKSCPQVKTSHQQPKD
ncbi:MAG: hypothetical protein LBB40_01620 [Holophagales bacterium]|jgi:phage terminase Nu1 subunit (DNA packaging protein)|nr:hypothetical protein [Holophagales bacterium]